MKIAIYTANIGGNVNNIDDDLHHYEDGVDYYYFTDDRSIHSKKWKVVYVNNDYPSTEIVELMVIEYSKNKNDVLGFSKRIRLGSVGRCSSHIKTFN